MRIYIIPSNSGHFTGLDGMVISLPEAGTSVVHLVPFKSKQTRIDAICNAYSRLKKEIANCRVDYRRTDSTTE